MSWPKSLSSSSSLCVWPPTGVTRNADPILFLPDTKDVDDLAALMHYFTSDLTQVSLIVDRRKQELSSVRALFTQLLSLLSTVGVREVYLLFCDVGDVDLAAMLISEFVVDFDVLHLEEPTALQLYVDADCIPSVLGGTQPSLRLDAWLTTQLELEHLHVASRHIEGNVRRFVDALDKDLSECVGLSAHCTREMAARERAVCQKLSDDLANLADNARKLILGDGVNVWHRLRLQSASRQLDLFYRCLRRLWHLRETLFNLMVDLAMVNERRSLGHSRMERRPSKVSLMSETKEENKESKMDFKSRCESVESALHERRIWLHSLLTLCLSMESVDKWSANAARLMQTQRGAEKQPPNMATVRRQRSFGDALLLHNNDEINNKGNMSVHHIRQLEYLLNKSRELSIQNHADLASLVSEIGSDSCPALIRAAEESVHRLLNMRARVMGRREELRQLGNQDCKHSLNDNREQASKIIEELMTTEHRYVADINSVLVHYTQTLRQNVHLDSLTKSLEDIHAFHANHLVPDLMRCSNNGAQAISAALIRHCASLKSLYSSYCRQLPAARAAITELGGEQDSILTNCQRRANHALPLSAYLLKPMQRITKYELLLRELGSQVSCQELEEAVREMRFVVTVVNDSVYLQDITLKGVPDPILPLGPLLFADVFEISLANKTKNSVRSMLMASNSVQQRHVLLYDQHLVVCKNVNERASALQYKFSLPVASVIVNSCNDDECRMQIWAQGRSAVYLLQAKNKETKAALVDALERSQRRQTELRDSSLRQRVIKDVASSPLITNETSNSNVDKEETGGSVRLSRSRSLAARRAEGMRLRSRSVDDAADRGQNSEDEHEDHYRNNNKERYVVLADYLALTDREIDLAEDEVVQLVKIGCAGWWYVRCVVYPYPEGWAPSTYLERIPSNELRHQH